ncbi:MAG: hypothetical protein KAS30_05505 [Candidatus Diapherotrites archaeon]|nr:hypothetical protein [Candidatus Diapherotrites archaeon]
MQNIISDKKAYLVFFSSFIISILILIFNMALASEIGYNHFFENVSVAGTIFSLLGISFKFFS